MLLQITVGAGAQFANEDLCVLVKLQPYTHLWTQAVGTEQKKAKGTGGLNEVTL